MKIGIRYLERHPPKNMNTPRFSPKIYTTPNVIFWKLALVLAHVSIIYVKISSVYDHCSQGAREKGRLKAPGVATISPGDRLYPLFSRERKYTRAPFRIADSSQYIRFPSGNRSCALILWRRPVFTTTGPPPFQPPAPNLFVFSPEPMRNFHLRLAPVYA